MLNTLFFNSDGSRSDNLLARPFAAAFDGNADVDDNRAAADAAAATECLLKTSLRVHSLAPSLMDRQYEQVALIESNNASKRQFEWLLDNPIMLPLKKMVIITFTYLLRVFSPRNHGDRPLIGTMLTV